MAQDIGKMRWYLEINGERQRGAFTTLSVIEGLVKKELSFFHRISADGTKFSAICNTVEIEKYIVFMIEKIGDQIREAASPVTPQNPEDLSELSGVHNISVDSLGISHQMRQVKQLQQANADIRALRRVLKEIRINRKRVHVVKEKKTSLIPDLELHPEDRDQVIEIREARNLLNTVKNMNTKVPFVIGAIALSVIVYMKHQSQQQEHNELAKEMASVHSNIEVEYTGFNRNQFAGLDDGSFLKEVDKNITVEENGIKVAGGIQDVNKLANMGDFQGNVLQVQKRRTKERINLVHQILERAYDKFQSSNYLEAEKLLLKGLQIPSAEKESLLILLADAIEGIEKNSPGRRTRGYAKLLERYMELSKTKSAKLLLLNIYMKFRLKDSLYKPMTDFLRAHPIAEGASFDQFYGYKEKLNWDTLAGKCITIYNSNRTDPLMSSMLAGCLVRTSKKGKAIPYAYYAYKKESDNPHVINLMGYSYVVGGDQLEAEEFLWNKKGHTGDLKYLKKNQLRFCQMYANNNRCKARVPSSR